MRDWFPIINIKINKIKQCSCVGKIAIETDSSNFKTTTMTSNSLKTEKGRKVCQWHKDEEKVKFSSKKKIDQLLNKQVANGNKSTRKCYFFLLLNSSIQVNYDNKQCNGENVSLFLMNFVYKLNYSSTFIQFIHSMENRKKVKEYF